MYGIVLAGWSSNNKYATMGGIRSTAQMISYELALGLAFVGPIMLAGSMSLGQIVETQSNIGWFMFWCPVGFIVYLIAALAEINRPPFDMPEAEQELTAGYHVEYSGMKFAMFMLTEYTKMIVVSVIAATLFLGGYQLPFQQFLTILSLAGSDLPWLGPLVLLVKVVLLDVWHYLGARHAAARALRPADGAGLEDFIAARFGECVLDGSNYVCIRSGPLAVFPVQRSIT